MPPPIVKKDPDFIDTLSVPPPSLIFNPGVVELNSTVFSILTILVGCIWNPPILPPVNNTCEPVTSPLLSTLNLDDDITGDAPVAVGSNLNKSA